MIKMTLKTLDRSKKDTDPGTEKTNKICFLIWLPEESYKVVVQRVATWAETAFFLSWGESVSSLWKPKWMNRVYRKEYQRWESFIGWEFWKSLEYDLWLFSWVLISTCILPKARDPNINGLRKTAPRKQRVGEKNPYSQKKKREREIL